MNDPQNCNHEWTWSPDPCGEKGWRCYRCGHQPGFRPDLDRTLTEEKASCLLSAFHESELIYISNGTMGMVVAENVAARCRREDRYDQKNILRFILADSNMDPDSTYWQEEAARVLSGPSAAEVREERERAGQLPLLAVPVPAPEGSQEAATASLAGGKE